MSRKAIKLFIPLVLSFLALSFLVLLCGVSLNAVSGEGQTETVQTVTIAGTLDEVEISPVLNEFTIKTDLATPYTQLDNPYDTLLECMALSSCPDVALIPTPGLLGELADQGALYPLKAVVPGFDTYFGSGWRHISTVDTLCRLRLH